MIVWVMESIGGQEIYQGQNQEKKRQEENEVWVTTIENNICLEPLLNMPDWFDEESPKIISRNRLNKVPGITGRAIERYKQARLRFRDDPNEEMRINERMNPFRGNVLTTILTPAKEIFKKSDVDNQVRETMDELWNRVAYRKNLSHRSYVVNQMIDEEFNKATPDLGKIEALKSLNTRIAEMSKMNPDEVKRIYQIGRYAVDVAKGRPRTQTDSLGTSLPEFKELDVDTELMLINRRPGD